MAMTGRKSRERQARSLTAAALRTTGRSLEVALLALAAGHQWGQLTFEKYTHTLTHTLRCQCAPPPSNREQSLLLSQASGWELRERGARGPDEQCLTMHCGYGSFLANRYLGISTLQGSGIFCLRECALGCRAWRKGTSTIILQRTASFQCTVAHRFEEGLTPPSALPQYFLPHETSINQKMFMKWRSRRFQGGPGEGPCPPPPASPDFTLPQSRWKTKLSGPEPRRRTGRAGGS